MLIFLGNSAFIYAIWSCVKNVCPFDNPVTFEFCNIHIIFLNGLTKGTLSYLILTTRWIHVNWCQILVIWLAILLQCISKDNTASWFSTSVVFIMSPVVSELTVISHYMLLFYVSDSDISLNRFLLSALLLIISIDYFVDLLLLLLQHGDTENNPGPKNKQVNGILAVNSQ